ncbi:MAG: hypothetical protein QNJ55_06695 [Xenococcus sp. MO_188.B8]|nr:hypothetical protein [Xenococcus sp. MO_188.B8]
MHYHLSLLLAIGITTLNSPNGNLSLESKNSQTSHQSPIVTKVTSTVESSQDFSVAKSESPSESETTELNTELFPFAIAGTAIITFTLLSFLYKKVDIVIDGEVLDLNYLEDESLDLLDTGTILEAPLSSSDTSLYQPDLVPELIVDLQVEDRNVRHKKIGELAQKGDPRAMTPLVELMIEADFQERSLILEAMTQITSLTLQPLNQVPILSLGDEHFQSQQDAIRDLTKLYELMSQVTKRLSKIINDSDQQVQKTAKWALKQLKQMPNSPTSQLTNLISN